VTRPLILLIFVSLPIVAAAQEEPLTIERAVELALANNERAAIADTAVEAAEARVRRGRAAFLPNVDITGNMDADFGDGTDRTLATSALLTQPIFNARAFPIYRQLRHLREAARFSADDSRRLLAFDAAAAFLTTLSFEQVQLAAQRRREFALTNLADVRARFEAGLVSSNDVTRAELELATAVRELAQAAGDVQASRIDLETLLKTDVGALAPPARLLDAADEPPLVEETDIAAAQQRRSDIAATRANVEALRAFADEPNARFLPSLMFNARTSNINEGSSITNRNQNAFVGVSMNWAVFDAGVRGAERAERMANVRGAELELQADLRVVEQQMRGSSVQLSTEQASLREAEAAVRAARKNQDETNALYREGLASALELADASQRLFEAEVAEVTARYRMALAYLSLREAAGESPVGNR
jgi:outer membrane protein TolC